MKMFKLKKGFTLVELIIVMVILGALAAIAIPKMGGSTDGALLASVKSDLRLATVKANELYSKELSYASVDTLSATKAAALTASPGNTIKVTPTNTNTTFTVTVTRAATPCKVDLTYDSSTGTYTSTTGTAAASAGAMPTLVCG